VRANYTFQGWATLPGSSVVIYSAGSMFTISSNVDLYAVWREDATYTVSYRGNGSTGGSAPVDSNRYYSGQTARVLAKGSLVKTNATFQGWARTSGATSATVAAGSSITINGNVILYAVWKTNATAPPTTTPPAPPSTPIVVVRPATPNTPATPPTTKTDKKPRTPTTKTTDSATTGQLPVDTGTAIIPEPTETQDLGSTRLNENVIPFGDFTTDESWSLLSLIFAVIAGLIAIGLILGYFVGRRKENENIGSMPSRGHIYKVLAIITGVITSMPWLILDDLNLRAAWINKWTLVVFAFFLIHIVTCLIYQRVKGEKRRNNFREEMEQPDIPMYR